MARFKQTARTPVQIAKKAPRRFQIKVNTNIYKTKKTKQKQKQKQNKKT